MTRLEMFSRTRRVSLCGVAAFASAALLACGGPKPIEGSSSLPGAGGSGPGSGPILTGVTTSTRTSTTTSTGAPPTEADGGNCGIETKGLTAQPADLLLVLDRSGSMADDIATDNSCTGRGGGSPCSPKWPAMTDSLNQVLASSPAGVQWGLKFFGSPNKPACTVNQGVEVAVGPNTAANIQAAIAGTSPSDNTPTKAAINAAVAYFGTVNDSLAHYILLATDGLPNCDPGNSSTVTDTSIQDAADAIAAALKADIRTYVVGIGAQTGNLDNFASAGGTGNYFPATSPDQLTAALGSIVVAVASCTFPLSKAPPNPDNVVVEFNGDHSLRPARDTTHTNGWDYTSPAHTGIQVYGSWCDGITNGTYKSTEILMACSGDQNPIK